jgi:hypothetical protein
MKVTPAPDHGVRWRASHPNRRWARSCTPQRFIGRSPQVETRLLLFFCLFEWPLNRLYHGKTACLMGDLGGAAARGRTQPPGHAARPVPVGTTPPSQWRRRLPPLGAQAAAVWRGHQLERTGEGNRVCGTPDEWTIGQGPRGGTSPICIRGTSRRRRNTNGRNLYSSPIRMPRRP